MNALAAAEMPSHALCMALTGRLRHPDPSTIPHTWHDSLFASFHFGSSHGGRSPLDGSRDVTTVFSAPHWSLAAPSAPPFPPSFVHPPFLLLFSVSVSRTLSLSLSFSLYSSSSFFFSLSSFRFYFFFFISFYSFLFLSSLCSFSFRLLSLLSSLLHLIGEQERERDRENISKKKSIVGI